MGNTIGLLLRSEVFPGLWLDPAALWWPNVAPREDTLHTLAVKALDLGIARDSVAAPPEDDES